MSRWVTVTRRGGAEDMKRIRLNLDQATLIIPDEKGSKVYLSGAAPNDASWISVVETPEQILALRD